jgi:hydroxymethylbilane synthase
VRADQVVRIGTRGSALARAQTDLVIRRLNELHPEIQSEVVIIQTEGDRDKETPLTVIGGRGVFTNALQDALRRGEIDVAVHSAKDLPTEEAPGLKIAAFLERADPRDVFVSRHGKPLAELGPNPVIGTSSRRRQVQVLKLRPDAQLVDLRGNIDTRLRKAFETDLDGIVVAAAGIERMNWSDRITEYLPLDIAVPSPGQGALAVEIRKDETGPASMISDLDEKNVSIPVTVERAFLRGTGGGCTSPIGAYATLDGDVVRLQAMLGSPNGSVTKWTRQNLDAANAEADAFSLAQRILAFLNQPLANKQVLVTRDDKRDSIRMKLANLGATPMIAPVVRFEMTELDDLDAALQRLTQRSFDWIVFTSANAVDALLQSPRGLEIAMRASVAAVGAATALRLENKGIKVALRPLRYSSDALVGEFATRDLASKSVLFPHGNLTCQTIPDGLRSLGADVETLTVYSTITVDELDPAAVKEISKGNIDAVMFFSPSGVHALKSLAGDRFDALKSSTVACIGATTASAARDVGLEVHVVPEESTIEGLIDALENYYAIALGRKNERVSAGQVGAGGSLA